MQLPSVNKSKVCNGKVGWSTKKWAVVSGMESKHLSNKSKLDGLGNQPWARSAISPICLAGVATAGIYCECPGKIRTPSVCVWHYPAVHNSGMRKYQPNWHGLAHHW